MFSLLKVYRGTNSQWRELKPGLIYPQCFDTVISILLPLKVKLISLEAHHSGQTEVSLVTDSCPNSKERWEKGDRLIFARHNLIEQKEMFSSDDDPTMW